MVSCYSDNSSQLRMPLKRLTGLLSVISRVCKVTCNMHRLNWLSLKIRYRVSDGRKPIGINPGWKRNVINYLETITNDSTWHMRVRFNIRCELYSSRPMAEREDIEEGFMIPFVVFTICNGPGRNTYELEGLHVKFLGIYGNLISEDSNMETILPGKKMLDG
jgi:hypothetical protein